LKQFSGGLVGGISLFAAAASLVLSRRALAQPLPAMSTRLRQAAAQTDASEREQGFAAERASTGPDRGFSQTMVTDHSKPIDAVKVALRTAGLPVPPPPLSGEQQANFATSRGLHRRRRLCVTLTRLQRSKA
jgi:hypothetical protein